MTRWTIVVYVWLLTFTLACSDRPDQTTTDAVQTDISLIHNIQLSCTGGEPVLLSRDGGDWLVNSKYPASPDAMRNLLDAVANMSIRFHPPQAAHAGIRQALTNAGCLVVCSKQDGDIISRYWIGGSTNDGLGAYFLDVDADKPLVVHLNDWEGNIGARFTLQERAWRDRLFFNGSDGIREISILYADDPEESFTLRIRESEYTVAKPGGDFRPANPSKVTAYLRDCDRLGLEAFENEHPLRKEITDLKPFCHISIGTGLSDTLKLVIFPGLNFYTSQNPVERNRLRDRYFASTHEGDFVLLQHLVLQNFLRGYSYFQGDDIR